MIRRAYLGVWCDYCKGRWGKNKGQWHPNAMRQAIVTIESRLAKSKGLERSYCRECMDEVQSWPDGSTWTLPEQVNYAKQVANV